MEEKKLNLDEPIHKYLDNDIIHIDSLHILEGVLYGRKITLWNLLSHTSGIADYMENPQFFGDVAAHGETLWTPEEIINTYYRYNTNFNPLFPPGKGFNYSDVNYVLLAMIIEKVTNSTLEEQLIKRIFNPLEMNNSYLEYYGAERGAEPFSHAFYSTMDLNLGLNTSFDWGGGGIVSTCEELNIFFKALLNEKLFQSSKTLAKMLQPALEGNGNEYYKYGLGIMQREIEGYTFYGHGGAYDCYAFYCPEQGTSICMSLNQMNTHGKRDKFVEKAITLIK